MALSVTVLATVTSLHLIAFVLAVGAERRRSHATVVPDKVSFLGAEACLLAGSARNAYHTKYRGIYGGEHLSCTTIRKGVFAAGAALTLLSMLGSILYYWSHSRADTGGWEKHQNEGVGMTASSYPPQQQQQQQIGEFEKV
ncbi:conserved hypothetical protein [Ricinus communis]|uniref:Fiber protein Fb34 n=1 Tax=Ricinus communis TaxID=3988 RepID=B9SM05_RICCO|nr:conserved hypothetical protein [Ricinus communis]